MPDVLHGEHFFRMKDGAVLANAGQFDVEISLDDLREQASSVRQILPLVERFEFGDRALHLLAGGRVVNLAAAEGHPAAVMDVSFALQALAAEALVREPWTPGVHPVPDAIEREVAALKLAALDVAIDSLSDAQARLPLAHIATARPLTRISSRSPAISTVSRLGRPMSTPWWMVIVPVTFCVAFR